MDSNRRTALVAGVLFIATFVTAIAAVLLYEPVLDDPGYVLGAGADTRVALGAVFELLLIVANIGTAVVLYPVLRRQNESAALGYVAARIVECTFIAVGIVSLLAVLTLRQDATAAPGTLELAGESLVAVHDWTFVLGPGFVVGIGNGLLLGYLMYSSGLVPRRMAMLGLIGGPLVCASGIAVALGAIDEGSAAQGIATIPEIAWEASLGIYLTFKGFKPSPILAQERPVAATPAGGLPTAAG
ncbi:MAG: DUF4386 domain-containing protein [Syntrophothermus sp.]